MMISSTMDSYASYFVFVKILLYSVQIYGQTPAQSHFQFPWIYGYIHGYMDISMDIWIYPWIYGYIHGYMAISMDIWLYPWISISSASLIMMTGSLGVYDVIVNVQ